MGHTHLRHGLEMLEERLLDCRSATRTLEKWCKDHALAVPSRIGARAIDGIFKEATQDQLELLQVKTQSDVAYRRVQLVCGRLLVCEADNWFVPSRLTDDMNRTLQTTDIPFGKVVAPLQVHRDTYSMTTFEGNMPWSSGSGTSGVEPWVFDGSQDLLHHRGLVLQDKDDLPLANVYETFKMVLLQAYAVQP